MLHESHLEYIAGSPYANDHEAWMTRMLQHGLPAPLPGMEGTPWLMPGSGLLPDGVYDPRAVGPYTKNYTYMVVTVAPDREDHQNRQHLSSNAGRVLRDALTQAGIRLQDVYFTTLMRCPLPFTATSYQKGWLQACLPYFQREFEIVRPQAVMLLGAEVCKMLLNSKYNMTAMRGQIQELTIGEHTARAISGPSHLAFAKNMAGVEALVKQLAFFAEAGVNPDLKAQNGLEHAGRDYKILDTPEDVMQAIAEEAALGFPPIAIDVETGTDTGRPDHEYVTTFQWSHGPGHARVIPLLLEHPEPVDNDGTPIYGGSGVDRKSKHDRIDWWDQAKALILDLLNKTKMVIGHNLRYDLASLRREIGLDPRQFYRNGRAWDTMLAYHLLAKDEYGLKQLVLRFTDMGAYDAPMHAWIIDNSGEGRLFPGDDTDRFFYGYRDIPFCYLLPYAMCDVDATYRVYNVLAPQLELPENAPLKQLYYEIELPVQLPIMDVEELGMPADENRLIELGDLYANKYESLIQEVRELLRWPTFNPSSAYHKRIYLYRGPFKTYASTIKNLTGKKGGVDLQQVPLLQAEPELTTGKFPTKWATLTDAQKAYYDPATDTDTLKGLYRANKTDPVHGPILERLLQLSELHQFVSLFLCEPAYNPKLCETHPIYGHGLRGSIRDSGRVCTRISTLSETGRWKHSDPNLANLPKSKEKGVEKIFGAKIPSVRSGFAAKDGWVFMEADYKSAELFTLGYMSKCAEFNKVLDEQPDVHGYNAAQLYALDCPPAEVEHRYPQYRAAIKATCFGIIYGLGPNGLAEQMSAVFNREVQPDEAAKLIELFLGRYPGVQQFIVDSKRQVEELGYVETAFGRRRYFPGYHQMSKAQQAAAKRQGTNARIQGTVGDYLNLASVNLDVMRYETDLGREIGWEYMVAIHDAILLHLPETAIQTTARILRHTMSETISFPGVPGKTLQVDIQYGRRWGEFAKLKLAA